MKKIRLLSIASISLMILFSFSLQAQIVKGSWGGGLNLGAQKGFGGGGSYPFGVGFEGLLTYRYSPKISLTANAGYRPIRQKGAGNSISSTKLAFSDLLVEYDVKQYGNITPFVAGGLGVYSIGFITANNDRLHMALEGAIGAGVRTMLSPQMEFKFALTNKITGDGVRNNNQKSYLTSTIGLTYYFKQKTALDSEDLFTDAQIDELPLDSDVSASPSQLVDYSRKLESDEDFQEMLNSDNPPEEIKEYKQLRERVNSLIELISQKDMEINQLQGTLTNGSSGSYAGYDGAGDSQVEFTYAYEDGLYKFYSRRYDNAIEIFNSLVQNYPNHYLASNCYYWLGEAFYSIRDYSQAVMSFEKVLANNEAVKRDDALYMMGKSYKELNQLDKSREAFGRVINEYPKSEFVSKSLEILSNLR